MDNSVVEIKKNKSKAIVLIVLALAIIACASLLILVLLNDKDSPKGSVDRKDDVLSILKNVDQFENKRDIGQRTSIEIMENDTPYEIIRNKSNLYGIKLSDNGTFTAFCSYEPSYLNYIEYSFNISSNNKLQFNFTPKSKEYSYETGISRNDDEFLGMYFVATGGCDSQIDNMLIEQFNKYILIAKAYGNDEPVKIPTSNDYTMFYVLSVEVGVCDEACNEGVHNYFIGETKDGDMYILTPSDEIKVDESLKFGYDFYEKDYGKGIQHDQKIYGDSIISGDKVIKAYSYGFDTN